MNLTKRHAEFAQKFIAEVAKQTTIEGLSPLLQKDYFKTDEKVKNRWDSGEHLLVETFGKRRRECLEVFTAKYVELATTEAQVLIGILTFRGAWSSRYRNHKEWPPTTWKIIKHIRNYFGFESDPNLSDSEWEESWDYDRVTYTESKYDELSREPSREPAIRKEITAKYDLDIVFVREISTAASIALIQKLPSFESCRLVYQVSHNNEGGKILLEKMFEYAKTKEEIFFVMQSMFGSKNNPKGYKKELKILTKKFLSLL